MIDEVAERLKAIRKREQEALAGPWGVDVAWMLEMVETYRHALQEIGAEYINGVNQVLEEIDKPAHEYSDLKVAQIRGGSLESISDIILDLEDDYLFEES